MPLTWSRLSESNRRPVHYEGNPRSSVPADIITHRSLTSPPVSERVQHCTGRSDSARSLSPPMKAACRGLGQLRQNVDLDHRRPLLAKAVRAIVAAVLMLLLLLDRLTPHHSLTLPK